MSGQAYTYCKDGYYINHRLGVGLRSERRVASWYWWLVRLLAGRRYRVGKQFHVLYEP
jgi:hypothetical protein